METAGVASAAAASLVAELGAQSRKNQSLAGEQSGVEGDEEQDGDKAETDIDSDEMAARDCNMEVVFGEL